MEIKYNKLQSGWPRQVDKKLHDEISNCTKRQRFKIGITNNPERRASQYRYNDYRLMHILYETSSIDHARELEKNLIAQFRDKCKNRLENIIGGGSGRPSDGMYYLYVVVTQSRFSSSRIRMARSVSRLPKRIISSVVISRRK